MHCKQTIIDMSNINKYKFLITEISYPEQNLVLYQSVSTLPGIYDQKYEPLQGA